MRQRATGAAPGLRQVIQVIGAPGSDVSAQIQFPKWNTMYRIVAVRFTLTPGAASLQFNPFLEVSRAIGDSGLDPTQTIIWPKVTSLDTSNIQFAAGVNQADLVVQNTDTNLNLATVGLPPDLWITPQDTVILYGGGLSGGSCSNVQLTYEPIEPFDR